MVNTCIHFYIILGIVTLDDDQPSEGIEKAR